MTLVQAGKLHCHKLDRWLNVEDVACARPEDYCEQRERCGIYFLMIERDGIKNRKTGRVQMPLYEYRCHACGDDFETLRGLHDKDEDVVCPTCGEKKAEKLLSACCTVKRESSSASTTSCGTKGFT